MYNLNEYRTAKFIAHICWMLFEIDDAKPDFNNVCRDVIAHQHTQMAQE